MRRRAQSPAADLCRTSTPLSWHEPMESLAMPRIRVVNPNSNEAVTRGIDEAVQPLRFSGGPEILCSTLAEGPFGVETQEHVESVTLPLRRLVESDNASDAFIIACYSDPGLHVCREGT